LVKTIFICNFVSYEEFLKGKNMEFKFNECPDYTTIAIEGLFIGGEEANNLFDVVQEKIKNGTKKIIFDLEKVNYIGSMAIGILIKINDSLTDVSGRIALCCMNQTILEVLKITKVDLMLSIFDSKEKAINFLSE